MKEITFDELKELSDESYELIDIRDEGLIAYGMISGAVHILLMNWRTAKSLQIFQRKRN